ncbi:3 beta-hydroxysteroid dehydrogenase/Delta 5--_4-isomerase [Planctomycetes bacterium Pan216]|uniref:3 beta-hydroxysteroid dehydrogenase/Delta 5-->4-isomerase n=1 Tax=Kolteria novifilia TaxID=2527975 RepID=A0A518AZL6_9BACT|nr:3 beta-hydroxysteroid dehydrogenase/Delta 5-->4-isomerase [Planctomycetes bacterium Pan216]
MNLVTGGAGFIGRHLVRQLVDAQEPVRVLDLSSPVEGDLTGVEWHVGDIRDRSAVRRAVEGCRRVYHLAANPNLWTRRRRDFDAVNHQGTVHVLREAVDAGCERVLHTSTESILTSRRFDGGAVEDLTLRREDMVGPYCLSKFQAEEAAMTLAREGAPVVIVNPTLPIGPGDYGLSPPTRMTVAACRGALPAYLDCQFNMIDVRDIATGLRLAMEKALPGRRYLLGAHNVTLAEWLRMVGERAGRKPPTRRVPYWLALGVAHASEWWADWISGRMPQATITGVKLTRYVMHFDPSRSLAELALSPRPLADSLKDAVCWYRRMGWI